MAGCSKSKDYPTLLTQLEKRSVNDEQIVSREIAADPVEQCLSDKFSTDVVKAEVKELEKKAKHTLVLSFGVAPEILGGVVLKVGDQVMDASLRAQLSILKDTIKRCE